LTWIKANCALVRYGPNVSAESFLDFDARPCFAQQRPPLPAILDAVHALAPGQAFRLTTPIEPVPLYAMLAGMGFSHQATRGPDGAWVVVFRR
jgi:uncharacterized protein (DUF2249 family)